jgi:DHA1 family tetracycline resistance protein-like MFS transporter
VRSLKPGLIFIFITLLLDVMGFGLLIPVGPKLVQHLQGGSEGDAAGPVGLLSATFALMQFVFAPTLGALSDHFGRRPVLLVAIFGSALDYLAMAFAPSLSWLFVTRAINGLSGASMTAASAYIADVTPPEKRAAGFGIIGAAFGLGFIIGPLIGGVLGEHDIRWPFFAAAGVTALNWLYGLLVLPESLPKDRRRKLTFARTNPLGVFAGLRKYPFVLLMGGALFFVNLAQFGLQITWVLYTSYRYRWTEMQAGLSMAFVGIGAAIVQGVLARRIIPALGERASVAVGMCIAILAYIGYGSAPQGWMLYVIILCASLGGIAQPAVQSLITRSVRGDEQGAVQGALTGIQSIAQIAGPLAASRVFAYFISDRAPMHVPGASFFLGAAFAFVGLMIAFSALALHKRAHDAARAG